MLQLHQFAREALYRILPLPTALLLSYFRAVKKTLVHASHFEYRYRAYLLAHP